MLSANEENPTDKGTSHQQQQQQHSDDPLLPAGEEGGVSG